jgi:hypothetical protein
MAGCRGAIDGPWIECAGCGARLTQPDETGRAVTQEADAPELQKRLTLLREEMRSRFDASIYLSVQNGRARLLFPDGAFVVVKEGKAVRIWPGYHIRQEDPDA